MLVLPRSARLAAWGSAGAGRPGTRGRRSARRHRGRRAARRPDRAPRGEHPRGGPGGAARGAGVGGASSLRVVLPAPGRPGGLPGPAAFTADAVDAGEAVLVEGELLLPDGVGRIGMVPEPEEFGSALEPGARVVWHCTPPWSPRAVDGTTLSDAERELRAALTAATRALADLDVAPLARGTPRSASTPSAGRARQQGAAAGHPGRAVQVAGQAARVRAIVELATEDDGAAVTSGEALARARSLREVDGVARRALAVAVNAACREGQER